MTEVELFAGQIADQLVGPLTERLMERLPKIFSSRRPERAVQTGTTSDRDHSDQQPAEGQ
jgi:hypothetical protein